VAWVCAASARGISRRRPRGGPRVLTPVRRTRAQPKAPAKPKAEKKVRRPRRARAAGGLCGAAGHPGAPGALPAGAPLGAPAPRGLQGSAALRAACCHARPSTRPPRLL